MLIYSDYFKHWLEIVSFIVPGNAILYIVKFPFPATNDRWCSGYGISFEADDLA